MSGRSTHGLLPQGHPRRPTGNDGHNTNLV